MRTLPKEVADSRNKTRYSLHYKLRKKGHTIMTKDQVVIRHNHELSKAEKRWIDKLHTIGYGITTSLFD